MQWAVQNLFAIVIAAAHAKKHSLGEIIEGVRVKASRNIIKNAFSVKIPGTNDSGINLAAALGMCVVKPIINMELLNDLKEEEIDTAKIMVEKGLITVELADTKKKLYVEVTVKTDKSLCKAVIEDFHDNLVLVEIDGAVSILENQQKPIEKEEAIFEDLNLDEILRFASEVDIGKLGLIKQCIKLNSQISFEGLTNCYGIEVGRNIRSKIDDKLIGNDISNQAVALTASGSLPGWLDVICQL